MSTNRITAIKRMGIVENIIREPDLVYMAMYVLALRIWAPLHAPRAGCTRPD